MRTLANFLKSARESAGLSQKEVSTKLGYTTPQFISNWERGTSYPPMDAVKILTKLYSVDLNTFYNLFLSSKIEDIKQELRSSLLGQNQSNANKSKKKNKRYETLLENQERL